MKDSSSFLSMANTLAAARKAAKTMAGRKDDESKSLRSSTSSSSITSTISTGSDVSTDQNSNCSLFDSTTSPSSSSSSLKGSAVKNKKEEEEKKEVIIPFIDEDVEKTARAVAAAVAAVTPNPGAAAQKKKEDGPILPLQLETGQMEMLKKLLETHPGSYTLKDMGFVSSTSKPTTKAEAKVEERELSKHNMDSLFAKLEKVKKAKLRYNAAINEEKLGIDPMLAVYMEEFERKGLEKNFNPVEWQIFVNRTISLIVEKLEQDPIPGIKLNVAEILPKQLAICKAKLEEIGKRKARRLLLLEKLGNGIPAQDKDHLQKQPKPKPRNSKRAEGKQPPSE